MDPSLTKQIMEKYFFFIIDNELKNNLLAFGFECGDGWYNLIDELCQELDELINKKYPYLKETSNYNNQFYPQFFVTQVKEKFGGLCFYVSGANDEIFDLIQKYEEKSLEICEICGKPGKTLVSQMGKGYWIKTLCPKHAEKLQYGEKVIDE